MAKRGDKGSVGRIVLAAILVLLGVLIALSPPGRAYSIREFAGTADELHAEPLADVH
jgi:hypothetical protein